MARPETRLLNVVVPLTLGEPARSGRLSLVPAPAVRARSRRSGSWCLVAARPISASRKLVEPRGGRPGYGYEIPNTAAGGWIATNPKTEHSKEQRV